MYVYIYKALLCDRHYVSNFAHDLLERLHYEPVFDVQNVNPQVYSTVPVLAQARVCPCNIHVYMCMSDRVHVHHRNVANLHVFIPGIYFIHT